MRTVYLGSSRLRGRGAAARSPRRRTRRSLVVTPPDRPQGRGRRTAPPPAAVAARELGLPSCFRRESVNDPEAVAAIADAAPEAIGVCEFGQLIKEPLLSQYLMLNVHPSLLPRWRGAAPIERALMAGDTVTGVTIFQLEEGLDSGPGGAQPRRGRSSPATRAARSAQRLSRARGDAADRGARPGRGGRARAATAAGGGRHLRGEDRPGGAAPRPGAAGGRAGAHRARAHARHRRLPGARGRRAARGRGARASRDAAAGPGELVADDGRLLVGCAEGALELLEVRPAGKRSMAGRRLPARAPARCAPSSSDARPPHDAAPTPSCAACSSRAPTPTARSAPRPTGWSSTAATARSRCSSPTERCSAGRRSTT